MAIKVFRETNTVQVFIRLAFAFSALCVCVSGQETSPCTTCDCSQNKCNQFCGGSENVFAFVCKDRTLSALIAAFKEVNQGIAETLIDAGNVSNPSADQIITYEWGSAIDSLNTQRDSAADIISLLWQLYIYNNGTYYLGNATQLGVLDNTFAPVMPLVEMTEPASNCRCYNTDAYYGIASSQMDVCLSLAMILWIVLVMVQDT